MDAGMLSLIGILLALILLVTAVQKIVERRMDSDTPRRRKRRVQK